MKRAKLLVIGMVIVGSMVNYAPAKAATTQTTQQQSSGLLGGLGDWLNSLFGGSGSGSSSGSGTGTASSGSGGGTSLPINGSAWLLVIAGVAVGYRAVSKNVKITPVINN